MGALDEIFTTAQNCMDPGIGHCAVKQIKKKTNVRAAYNYAPFIYSNFLASLLT
jgi:hypothetical protein